MRYNSSHRNMAARHKDATWIESSEFHSYKYQISVMNRVNKRGGLALICSSKYKAETLPHTQYDSFESVLCTQLYNPSQGAQDWLSNNIFLDDITNLLTDVSCRFNSIILLGDLNIHMEDQEDNDTTLLSDTLEAFNLTQHIRFPMHNLKHSAPNSY